MKILPNITPRTKWFNDFKRNIRHFGWCGDLEFSDVEYLYEDKRNNQINDPIYASVQYVADRYNKSMNEKIKNENIT